MRIEVWSDVVCPWCYIGKRRLESALEGFGHADAVEVVYRSFELDPAAPRRATEPVVEVLARKYGGGVENARVMMDRVTEVAEAEGLEYNLDRTLRGNTVDAHRLLHLALDEHGPRAQATLKEALLAAYFTRVEDVADPAVLRSVAVDSGLGPARVDQVLAGDEYADAVREDVAQARALGATGVPFFVVDRRYGVAGAQPVEVLREMLERAWAWADARPPMALVGSDGDVCGPEGCD
jgi:predicted DsbA family dithiol-disulfide isomerase